MIKRFLVLYIAIAAVSLHCYGLTIQAGVASREVHSDTSTVYRNTTGLWDVVTQPFTAPDSGGRCVVLAFRLPVIAEGQMIAHSSFSIYYVSRLQERIGTNDSLYAIDYRADSTVLMSDYFEGEFFADANNDAIESDLTDFDSPGSWQRTTAKGNQRLTKFLRRQYENGAKGGEWIFLRINSAQKGYSQNSRHSYASVYYEGGTQWAPSVYTPYIEYTLAEASELCAEEKIEAGKSPELTPNLAVELYHSPIEHQPYFLCERERLGYNPRYAVNSLQFDSRNRPYSREMFAVCTLNDEGKWLRLNFKNILADAFPEWDGTLGGFGPASDDRIVFDNDDDAYMLLKLNNIGHILMHSKDYCRRWDVIPLQDEIATARIEYRDGHNDLVYPPTIVTRTYSASGGAAVIDLITPSKDSDGRVRPSVLIPINRGAGFWISALGGGLNAGKGSANLSASLGSKVHVVFAGRYTVGTDAGTPQYAASYDRVSKTVTAPFYLGSAGVGEPDEHNWPGVALDGSGYVNAVLGAHGGAGGQCFKYRKSVNPNDSTQFEDLINLPSGFTYLSLLCDKSNNLHVVARHHWDPYVQKLKHLAKPAAQSWDTVKQDLVVPFIVTSQPSTYNRYDQTLDIDRLGNLYITYWNGTSVRMDDAVAQQAFQMKWPNEVFKHTTEGEWTNDIYYDMQSNQTRRGAIIVSKDNGKTWKILETKDFLTIDGRIAALPQSRELQGCAGPVEATSGTWQLVSTDYTCQPQENAYTNLVMAFKLPQLPAGYEFGRADMKWYYHYQKRTGAPIDIYGLGLRSGDSPNISANDFYIGYDDTEDAYSISRNVIDYAAGTGRWIGLNAQGQANMAAYLNSLLAGGANEGDWILIRFNIQYRWIDWYSAHTIRSCHYSDTSYTPYIEYQAWPAQ